MQNLDYIEVHIKGLSGGNQLTPYNYDIADLKDMLSIIINLFPNASGNNSTLSLKIEDGSVRQLFYGSKQRVLLAATLIGMLVGNETLDGIDPKTACQVELLQKTAIAKGYTYEIFTNQSLDEQPLCVSPATKFQRIETTWVDGEFYLYGNIVNAGGKAEPNIHLDTKDFGVLTISTNRNYLENQTTNLIYHTCGVRAVGKQNVVTGEFDKGTLELIELIDYSADFDSDYLEKCIKKASPSWKDVENPTEWLYHIREV